MKVYFSHGKDSGPNGYKISYLSIIAQEMNFKTVSIDYTTTKNPDKRVNILLNTYDKNDKQIVLYGSSMGAYVCLAANGIIKPKGLFLCAPALYLPNYSMQFFSNLNIPITIVHGYYDDIVSYKNSVEFAEKNACELHILNDNHSLANSQSIISFLFRKFLEKLN